MKKITGIVIILLCPIMVAYLGAHCQIPCGIYDDEMRFDMMTEHIATIEKSMNQIIALSGEENKNMNQIVRWVTNRDHHADELTHIVTYYFMAQRLKPVEKKDSDEYNAYVDKLTLLQRMVFYSMKAKQTTDLDYVRTLRDLLAEFKKSYFNIKDE